MVNPDTIKTLRRLWDLGFEIDEIKRVTGIRQTTRIRQAILDSEDNPNKRRELRKELKERLGG